MLTVCFLCFSAVILQRQAQNNQQYRPVADQHRFHAGHQLLDVQSRIQQQDGAGNNQNPADPLFQNDASFWLHYRQRIDGNFVSLAYFVALMISSKESVFSEAPPIRAPSISSMAMYSLMLFGLTDPPY